MVELEAYLAEPEAINYDKIKDADAQDVYHLYSLIFEGTI
jgi:hypothetical protein